MKLIQLLENLIDIRKKDIKIENGKMLRNQFPNKVNMFSCSGLETLISLENCPQEVNYFYCSHTHITNLEYAPKIIKGEFSCIKTKITSLEDAPLVVKELFLCYDNEITSLQGIGRKYLKECKKIELPNTIKSNILGLCLVNKLEEISIFDAISGYIYSGPLYEALEIIQEYLQTDGDECREELIQNGYKDYAKF